MHLLADHADAHVKRLARSGRYLTVAHRVERHRRAVATQDMRPLCTSYAGAAQDGAVAPIRIVLFILPLPFGVSHTRFALVVIPSGHAGSVDCYLGATRPWRGTRSSCDHPTARPCRERNDAPGGAPWC